MLYADQRLGLGPVGFGLLSTATAVGGFVGTASYHWLERHAGLATLIRVGLGLFGGILLGQLVGGLLARAWGVTGPFWFGFAGSAVILALIWRQLAHIAHVGDEAEEVAERV